MIVRSQGDGTQHSWRLEIGRRQLLRMRALAVAEIAMVLQGTFKNRETGRLWDLLEEAGEPQRGRELQAGHGAQGTRRVARSEVRSN